MWTSIVHSTLLLVLMHVNKGPLLTSFLNGSIPSQCHHCHFCSAYSFLYFPSLVTTSFYLCHFWFFVNEFLKCDLIRIVWTQVWATLPFYHREGSMGDYIVVTEEFLSKKPRNISHEEAAALPNVGTCVWCSLVLTAVIGSKRTKQQRLVGNIFTNSQIFKKFTGAL